MTDAKLKSIVDRIERLEEEQRGLGQDKRDIFTEAKSSGYNPKVLRRLIRERKRDTAEQAAEDAELETYRAALGMAVELVRSGLSQRKAAKQAGVSKSSLNRALAVPAVSHDPETGEITETRRADAQSEAQRRNSGDTLPAGPTQTAASEAAPGDDTGTGETEGAPAPVVAITVNPQGEKDDRTQTRDADGASRDSAASTPERNSGSEGRGDESVRADAAHKSGLPDARYERGPGMAPSAGAGQDRAGRTGSPEGGLAPGPQDTIDLAESHPAFLKGSAPGNRKAA